MQHNPPLPRLYGITDSQLMPGEQLFDKVEAAVKAGVDWIQYRDKSGDRTRRTEEAQTLITLCHRHGAKLLINDDLELARRIGADGVHLGQDDTPVHEAVATLGQGAIVGATCHASLQLAVKAEAEGATYVAFGRFFPSRTKPGATPAPLSLLRDARARIHLPSVAIGGINADNARRLIDAGATTLAVCHSLFADDQVEYRTQQLLKNFNDTG